MLKYQKLLSENNLKLDSEVLDPAFVEKAKDLQARIQKKAITDDEIEKIDDELVALFNLLEIQEVESEDLKKANHRAAIAEAKQEISEATTVDELNQLKIKFINLPELQPFIEKRVEKFEKQSETEKQKKFITDAKGIIQQAPFTELEALLETYKEYPELIEEINKRLEKEKQPKEKTIREKLIEAKKREWSFHELAALGIKVTEDDMTVEGVFLERQFMFKTYKIMAVDGKKV